ncbi:UvrD-helicase domain-containing protein [Hippea jasoniae]|uniref:UvrD-helicase domain-containing protein n=1 Tax=Hippea jasoniae TaxID=944479 RepID=UPI00054E4281|nr:UvrD-helicase domain-containing protein [Hippea jasoniae]
MNGFKRLLIVEASAGSGKTYSLARRFIDLLTGLSKDKLSSIIAITFTNKAAAEMRERIISILEAIANKNGNVNLNDFALHSAKSPEIEARNILIDILNNYSDFNVSTIDSFMNRILRSLSVMRAIRPDYEVSFDKEELIDLSFSEMLLDKNNHEGLLKLLEEYLTLNPKRYSLNPIFILKSLLLENTNISSADWQLNGFKKYVENRLMLNCNGNYRCIEQALKSRFENMINQIADIINSSGGVFNANKAGIFTRQNSIDYYLSDEKRIEKLKRCAKDVGELYKKNKSLSDEIEDNFKELVKEAFRVIRIFYLLKKMAEIDQTIKFTTKLNKNIELTKKRLNVVFGDEILRIVGDILKSNSYSYNFIQLAEKLRHYLIDEFQDTSSEQFKALKCFIDEIENSTDGSIFVVGDKKQAIYGWRGGDFRLFNKFGNNYKKETLDTNYRSCRNIVEFNNELFSYKNIENFAQLYDFGGVGAIYENVKQKCSKNCEGFVKVVVGSFEKENEDDFYEQQLKDTIDFSISQGESYSNIMVLLRRNSDIKKTIAIIKKHFPEVPVVSEDFLIVTSLVDIKKILALASFAIERDGKETLEVLDINLSDEKLNELKQQVSAFNPYEFFAYLIDFAHQKEIIEFTDNRSYFESFLDAVFEFTQKGMGLYEVLDYFLKKGDVSVSVSENVDAIKVMSIHKAKGLDSNTVIIPYYDWNFTTNDSIYGSFDIADLIGKKKNAYVKIDKKLAIMFDAAGDIYKRHKENVFVEALNLMYVANTRPKGNLFIIGNLPPKKSGKNNDKPLNAIDFIIRSLKMDVKENGAVYKVGQFRGEKLKTEQKEAIKSTFRGNFTNRLNIFSKVDIEGDVEKIKLGDVFHEIMSKIDKTNNIDNLVDEVCMVYNIPDNDKKTLKQWVKNTLEDLSDYFYSVDAVYVEKEFVDSQGNILRPDRIVIKDSVVYVIDYKTGIAMDHHKDQIKSYTALFEKAKGLLYYVKDRRIVDAS